MGVSLHFDHASFARFLASLAKKNTAHSPTLASFFMPAPKGKTKKSEKRDVLYLSPFPPELKERCEGIAGFLGVSVSKFVAHVIRENTKDLDEFHASLKRKYPLNED